MSEHHQFPPPRVSAPATSLPGPDPVRLAGLLARAWLEVRARRRPLAQLDPLLSPAVRRRLAGLVADGHDVRARQAAQVRRVWATAPCPLVCEAVVVVAQGGRTTAIAVRLERHRGRWRAVELAAPESGLPALRTASAPTEHRSADAFDEVLAEVGEGS
jgi:hypothetical protein